MFGRKSTDLEAGPEHEGPRVEARLQRQMKLVCVSAHNRVSERHFLVPEQKRNL